MGQIWRLHIKPSGGKGDPALAVDLCVKKSVLGMGWGVDADPSENLAWEQYEESAKARFGNLNSNVRRWKQDVNIGDLVWTRTRRAEYLLARVTGEWRYDPSSDFVDADMINMRPVDLIKMGNESNVPGKVVSAFRPRKTLQRILGVSGISKYLWDRSEETAPKYGDYGHGTSIFDILSAQDVEDVISIMLQMNGFLCAPTRRQADTMAYEYLMRSRDGKRNVAVQVKTGNSVADAVNFPADVEEIVLFSTKGRYGNRDDREAPESRWPPERVEAFIKEHLRLLPQAIVSAYDLHQTIEAQNKE